jgi:hypothetical protein
MPGFLLHLGATVKCPHGGTLFPTAVSPSVFVTGQPIVTQPAPHSVLGCPLTPSQGGPDTLAQFTTAAVRVKSFGQPVLLFDSQATCVPTGSPVVPVSAQTRAVGT